MAIDARKTDTALAIADPRRELQELINQYPPDKFILLVPSTQFGFSPMFRAVITEVGLDVAQGSKDIYQPAGGRQGEVAIHASGLKRISNALAVTWENTRVDETRRWKWRAEAAGWILHPNGDRIRHSARYTLDVSDDEAVVVKRIRVKAARNAAAAKSPAERQKALEDADRDIDSYRQFGEQRAETGAKSRVIQDAANLQKTYALGELVKKRFAALHWRPDERHPKVAEALIKRMGQASDIVFGAQRELPASLASIAGTVHERDAGEGDEADVVGAIDTTAAGAEEPEIPDADAPEPKDEIPGITAAIVAAAAKGGDQQPAADELLMTLGTAARDMFGLTSGKAAGVVLRSVGQLVFGDAITSWRSFTRAQATTLIALTKEPAGQEQLRKLLTRQLERDESLADVKAQLAKAAA